MKSKLHYRENLRLSPTKHAGNRKIIWLGGSCFMGDWKKCQQLPQSGQNHQEGTVEVLMFAFILFSNWKCLKRVITQEKQILAFNIHLFKVNEKIHKTKFICHVKMPLLTMSSGSEGISKDVEIFMRSPLNYKNSGLASFTPREMVPCIHYKRGTCH